MDSKEICIKVENVAVSDDTCARLPTLLTSKTRTPSQPRVDVSLETSWLKKAIKIKLPREHFLRRWQVAWSLPVSAAIKSETAVCSFDIHAAKLTQIMLSRTTGLSGSGGRCLEADPSERWPLWCLSFEKQRTKTDPQENQYNCTEVDDSEPEPEQTPSSSNVSETNDHGHLRDLLANVSEEAAVMIHNDVPRTSTQLSDLEQHRLQMLLFANAGRCPEVGYCQGINNIAAVLVTLGFDEAKARTCLRSLLVAFCPGYHAQDLRGWRRDAMVLGSLMRQCLHISVWQAFEALQTPLELLAADHFLTLASYSWPLEATLQLWDLLYSDGPSALFASFLALLDLFLPRVNVSKVRKGKRLVDDVVDTSRLEAFKTAARHGVAEDIGKVMASVRKFIPLVPQNRIDHLRWIYTGETPPKE